MNTRTSGYFVAILRDNYGATTHAVAIDLYRRELYDAMEPNVLPLDKKSLDQCCGAGRLFVKFSVVGELNYYVSNVRRIDKKKLTKANI